jgi:transcriptional regulator GlxA family with amidase domain
MVPSPRTTPVSVSLLALPETTPASLYGLLEVFSAVGVTWHRLTGEGVECQLMAPRIVARSATPFPSTLNVPIAPDASIDEVGHTDIVVVTDLDIVADNQAWPDWGPEAEWIRNRYADGAIVCSVCTGSVFLGEAGLLDGLEATTHWSAAELFRRRYPAVRLRPERILCPAGREHRIVTGGGVSAWEDLALYLVARFCGETEAVRIAKIFLLGDRSEGQLPFSAMARPRRHDDAVIAETQNWIAEHYDGPNPVGRMVRLSGLTTRTFKRRFKAATGYSPMDYVQALRIEEAKQILETSTEPTDMVAHLVGYGDPAFFRRLFRRRTGVTPARYRRRFQAITGGRPRGGCSP